MKTGSLVIIILSLWLTASAQKADTALLPVIFEQDVISLPDRYEFGSVLNKSGDELYFGVSLGGQSEILYTKRVNDEWTEPLVILSDSVYGYNDPMLSPDESKLYFISDRPLDGRGDPKDIDIWFVSKTGDGWSQPVNAGPAINTERNEYYISFTASGAMYFASNRAAAEDKLYDFDIYRSENLDGVFQVPVKLPEAVNTSRYEADVFVAPDESYLIFSANRKDGLGRGDLYISFKDEQGHWTTAENMGALINSEGHELCPFVSADGQYLYYTSRKDIYRIEASVIDRYRADQ